MKNQFCSSQIIATEASQFGQSGKGSLTLIESHLAAGFPACASQLSQCEPTQPFCVPPVCFWEQDSGGLVTASLHEAGKGRWADVIGWAMQALFTASIHQFGSAPLSTSTLMIPHFSFINLGIALFVLNRCVESFISKFVWVSGPSIDLEVAMGMSTWSSTESSELMLNFVYIC